jgi:hypothetical protein
VADRIFSLSAGGAVTQSGALTAAGLELRGTGPYTLTNAGNDVASIAANAGASIDFVDANALLIGTVAGIGTTGITTSDDDVRLEAGTTLGIGAAVALGAGDFSIDAGGAVSQTAAITAAGLELLGATGAYDLSTVDNAVTTLAGNTGSLKFLDNTGFSIGTVNTAGLTTSGDTTLLSDGAVTQTQLISASGLRLSGAGTYNLPNAGNNVTTLAADAGGGDLRYTDTGGFAVGTVDGVVGIDFSGRNVTLTAGGAVTQSAAIMAAGLELLGGTGAYDLGTVNNTVTTLAGNTGSVKFLDNTGFSVGTVNTMGLTTSGNTSLSSTNTVTQSEAITAAGLELLGANGVYDLGTINNAVSVLAGNTGTVTFLDNTGFSVGMVNAAGLTTSGDATLLSAGAVTQSQLISAAGLRLSGTGTFTLQNAGNDVTTLAANPTGGDLKYTDSSGFSIGTVDTLSGINVGANRVTLTAGGAVTQTAAITAAGLELLGASGAYDLSTVDNAVTTLAGNTGSVKFLDNTGFSIGAVHTAGLTTSGDTTFLSDAAVTQSQPVSAAGLRLSGAGTYTLQNGGNSVATLAANPSGGDLRYTDAGAFEIGTVDGISGVAIGADTLTLTAGGAVTQAAAITAGGLSLLGAGSYALTQAGNDINTLSGSVTGAIKVTDAGPLQLTAVAGTSDLQSGSTITLSTGGALTQDADGEISAAGLEVRVSAGGAVLSQANDIDTFAAAVTGALSLTDTDGFVLDAVGATSDVTASSTVSFSSGGAVSQAGTNGELFAGGLSLLGAGSYTLTQAANDIDTFAAAVTGALSLTDTDGFVLDAVGATSDVTASSTVSFSSGGAVTQAGANGELFAGGLSLLGAGSYTLTQAANDINTLSGNVTGAIKVTDAGPLQLTTVAGTSDLQSGSTITLNTGGSLTQDGNGEIRATGLALFGTGPAVLTQAGNDVNTLSGNVTGAIQVTDAGPLLLTAVGGTSNLQSGSTVTLSTGGALTQDATGVITATGLELSGTGPVTLTQAGNDINTLSGNVAGAIRVTDAGPLLLTLVGGTSNLQSGSTITLNTGGTLTQDANGVITATGLEVLGAGPVTLTQVDPFLSPVNDVDTIAGNTTNAIAFSDLDDLIVGTVNTIGLTTAGGDITLFSESGAILVDAKIDSDALNVAGGNVTLDAGGGLTVSALIDTRAGAGGTLQVGGGVTLNTTPILGAGNVDLNQTLIVLDKVVIADIVNTTTSVTISAPRDIEIYSLIQTTDPTSDIIITADADGTGDGGVLLGTAGQIDSARDVIIRGSDLFSTPTVADSIVVEADGTNNQITAGRNIQLLSISGAPAPPGSEVVADIIVNGRLTTTGGSILIDADRDILLSTAMTSGGGDITLSDPTVLTGTSEISTGSGAGTITFSGALDGTTDFAEGLTLTAGTGGIDFDAAVGGSIDLGVLAINSAGYVTADSTIEAQQVAIAHGGAVTLSGNVNAPGGFSSAGTTFSSTGTITTTDTDIVVDHTGAVSIGGALSSGLGRVDIDATGAGATVNLNAPISTTAGDVTIDSTATTTISGAGDIVNTGVGNVDLGRTLGGTLITAGDVSTASGSITFRNATTLSGTVNLTTGAGPGDIRFAGTLNGANDLNITAGAGSVTFVGGVGAAQKLGSLTIFSATGGVAANAAVRADAFDITDGGDVSLKGAVTADNGFSSSSSTPGSGDTGLFDNTGGTVTTTNSPITIAHDGNVNIAAALSSGTGSVVLASTGGTLFVQQPVQTTGGSVSLDANGLTTLASAADVVVSGGTGGVEFGQTGAGSLRISSSVTTADGAVNFRRPVQLGSDLAVDTGVSGGIRFFGPVTGSTPGSDDLALAAGSGTVQFDSAVGTGALPMGNLSIAGAAGGVTLSGSVDAASVSIVNGGPVVISAAVAAPGGFSSSGITFTKTGGAITTVGNPIRVLHNGAVLTRSNMSTTGGDVEIRSLTAGSPLMIEGLIQTAGGDIFVATEPSSPAGTLSPVGAGYTLNAGAGTIRLSTGGDLALGSLVTTNSNFSAVTVSSALGSITDANANLAGDNIDANNGRASLTAAGGIGDGNPLEIRVASLEAHAGGTGNIGITEVDTVTLADVDTTGGAIQVAAGGSITASDVHSGGGSLGLNSGAAMSLGAVSAGAGPAAVNAVGSINGGTITANTLQLNAATAGLSSPVTVDVYQTNVFVDLSEKNASGISGIFAKGAALTATPPTGNLTALGTVIFQGLGTFLAGELADIEGAITSLATASKEQEILDEMLRAAREAQYFLTAPLEIFIEMEEEEKDKRKEPEEAFNRNLPGPGFFFGERPAPVRPTLLSDLPPERDSAAVEPNASIKADSNPTDLTLFSMLRGSI